jgi:tartronate-semialdehyde synthase
VEFAEITGVPVIPTLMGWGAIPDDHPLMAGMAGLQTSHRYGNATLLASDFVLGIGNRWANRHTGSVDVFTKDRKFVHIDIEPTQIGRVFGPGSRHRLGRRRRAGAADRGGARMEGRGQAGRPLGCGWAHARNASAPCCADALRHRAGQAAAGLRGDEQVLRPRHLLRQHSSACRRSPPRSSCTCTSAPLDQLRPGRPARLDHPGRAGRARGRSGAHIVAISGDYDFQFLIEELAVGAQFKLPISARAGE